MPLNASDKSPHLTTQETQREIDLVQKVIEIVGGLIVIGGGIYGIYKFILTNNETIFKQRLENALQRDEYIKSILNQCLKDSLERNTDIKRIIENQSSSILDKKLEDKDFITNYEYEQKTMDLLEKKGLIEINFRK